MKFKHNRKGLVADSEKIKDRVYCEACGQHDDVEIPIRTVVIGGLVLDCRDKTCDRVICGACGRGDTCRSVDL